jgi:ATP-binding cassette, subfamily C, bacterial LapB
MIDLSARVGADAKREKEAPDNSERDSLCDALLFLAAFHGRAMTREALLFGLPIEDNRLSIPLFDRAAHRAGLEAESVARPLGDIPAFVLPAVLILQDQSARILSKIDTRRKKRTVINPSTREHTEVEAAALESDYLGHAFFVRPVAASEQTLAAAEAAR